MSPGNMVDAPEPSRCAWYCTFWPAMTDVEQSVDKGNACSDLCKKKKTLNASSSIPTSADISWILFRRSLHTTLYTRLMFSSFVEADCRPQRGTSLTLARPSRKRLCHSWAYFSFLDALSYFSSGIITVSAVELCSKAQHFIFFLCSVTDVFKCDMRTIHRNKQLTLNENNA
jgi:hypothetical protein